MPFASAVLIAGRWNFGDDLCQVQDFLSVRRLLNSSNNGIIDVKPVRANRRQEPVRQDPFTAQIETLAELRVALSPFVSTYRWSEKLVHI